MTAAPHRRSTWPFVSFASALLSLAASAFAQVGDAVPVHDPSAIVAGGRVYVFSTGHGLSIRSSPDLYHWQAVGSVFAPLPPTRRSATATSTEPATRPTSTAAPSAPLPAWARDYSGGSDYFWAPDVTCFAGEYHVYYAASSFGKTRSAIGLATNKTLDPASPDYRWTDRGVVVATPPRNDWNAIDPAVFLDDPSGKTWLVCGSWWSGLKLFELDPATGKLARPDDPPAALAARPGTPGGGAIEEGYLTRHGGRFYLWASFDHCCRGVRSDYRIVVGRSDYIGGPYADRDGRAMLAGGGTTVLATAGDLHGPGSCAVVRFADADWLLFHYYDGTNRGRPTLQVRPLTWDADGWPVAGEPIRGPVVLR